MIQLSYFHPFPYLTLSQNTLFGIWSFLWTCLLYPPWEDPWAPELLNYQFAIPDNKSELLKIMLMKTDKKPLGRKKPKSRTTTNNHYKMNCDQSVLFLGSSLFVLGLGTTSGIQIDRVKSSCISCTLAQIEFYPRLRHVLKTCVSGPSPSSTKPFHNIDKETFSSSPRGLFPHEISRLKDFLT